MANLKETNYLSSSDNTSENTIRGITLAFEITLDTLGVDKHTGRRVLKNIEALSKEQSDSEIQDGMMKVYSYIENQIGDEDTTL